MHPICGLDSYYTWSKRLVYLFKQKYFLYSSNARLTYLKELSNVMMKKNAVCKMKYLHGMTQLETSLQCREITDAKYQSSTLQLGQVDYSITRPAGLVKCL